MTTTLNGNTILNAGTSIEAWSPSVLFAAGEQGVWYDPSDLTTMFTDAAGTTPVGAPGNGSQQLVGRINDKSGRGNNATQSTAGNRPELSARVNSLTKTEQFNDTGVWTLENIKAFGSGSVANATTAPDGTVTADNIVASATSGAHDVYSVAVTAATGVSYTTSICVKADNYNYYYITQSRSSNNYSTAVFDLTSGTTATQTSNGSSSGAIVSTSKTDLGNGWFRLSLTAYATGTQIRHTGGFASAATGNTFDAGGNVTFSAAGTESVYVWGADLRVSNDGVGLPVYQRVNTATDYAVTGFPYYLRFDGTDDSMATASINFTSTDKMTVFGGVRKLSDAATQFIAETSASASANNGAFGLAGPVAFGLDYKYAYNSRGTVNSGVSTTSTLYAAPISSVLSGLSDISNDVATLRINGIQIASSSSDQGTGNYGTYPLYIGARESTSFFLNGRLYSLIVRGAASTSDQISATEAWVNTKTKAY